MTNLTKRLILALALMAGLSPAFAQSPPPVPALPDSERRTSYSISGTNCTCAVGFQLYADSNDVANWLEVFINGVRANFNDPSFGWAITSPTGSIASIPRPITDAVLTFTNVQTGTIQIVGARRPRRTTTFQESQPVPTRNFNQVFNDLTAMLREDWDKINDVSGRAIMAPPGETLALLPAAATRANQGACFDNGGNLVNCVSVPSTTFTAGNGIVFTGVGPTSIKANLAAGPNVTITGTNPLSINVPLAAGPGITLTGSNPLTIGLSASSSVQVFSTRANAAAQNLTGITAIQTLGYAAAGDGGGATFKNIGSSAQPCDSGILTGTISAAGSAYTNGTYHAVSMTGGNGVNLFVNVTVSGGGVTAVAILNQGGNCFKVGDVLTSLFGNATIGGTGSGFTYTVSTISTPLASFTDTAGNRFQYVVGPGSFIDPRAFGALFNFNPQTGDGAAHDDGTNIQAAINFAAYVNPIAVNYTTGTLGSGTVQLPGGSAMVCSSKLFVWNSVVLRGQGPQNTTLKICDTGLPSATDNFITLCDPNAQVACFGAQIQDLNLAAAITGAPGGVSTYMVYSNAAQQDRVISNVSIYGGKRGCFRYDTGFGGAAMVGVYDLFCTVQPNSISDGVVINAGTTMVMLRNLIAEGSYTGNAVNLIGGQIVIDGFHTEGITIGINVNLTVSTHSAVLMNASGGNTCTSLVVLQSTNTVGNFAIFNAVKNGCSTNLVLDGQPSGTNKTTDAKPSAGWVVFNP